MISRSTFILAMILVTNPSLAAPVFYNDQATFLAALTSSTTFDFETASGFPADGPIGNFGRWCCSLGRYVHESHVLRTARRCLPHQTRRKRWRYGESTGHSARRRYKRRVDPSARGSGSVRR